MQLEFVASLVKIHYWVYFILLNKPLPFVTVELSQRRIFLSFLKRPFSFIISDPRADSCLRFRVNNSQLGSGKAEEKMSIQAVAFCIKMRSPRSNVFENVILHRCTSETSEIEEKPSFCS
uniref:(northern house mosquito) hypothetical protein n=1 Tax=Culex pipiens TaxID=7175 RepID=A0A8D8DF17_CULPI